MKRKFENYRCDCDCCFHQRLPYTLCIEYWHNPAKLCKSYGSQPDWANVFLHIRPISLDCRAEALHVKSCVEGPHEPGTAANTDQVAIEWDICIYFQVHLLRHFESAVLRAKPVKHLQKFSHSNRWIQFPLGSIRLYGLVGPDRDIFPIPPIPAHVIPKISGTGWLGLPRWMEGTQEVLWSIKKCQHKSLLGGFHLPTCGSDFQWPKQAAWLGALPLYQKTKNQLCLANEFQITCHGMQIFLTEAERLHSIERIVIPLSVGWIQWCCYKNFYPKSPQNNLHKKNVNPKRQRGPSSQWVYGFQDEFVRRHAQTKLLVLGVASTLAGLQQSYCRHMAFNHQTGPHLWLRGKDCGTRWKPSEYHSSTCSTLLHLFFWPLSKLWANQTNRLIIH